MITPQTNVTHSVVQIQFCVVSEQKVHIDIISGVKLSNKGKITVKETTVLKEI